MPRNSCNRKLILVILTKQKMSNDNYDMVNHPSHYTWLKTLCGVEPIDICRQFDFNVGNALKYIMRKGKKDGDMTDNEKRIQDLQKAVFYLNDEIALMRKRMDYKDDYSNEEFHELYDK